MPETRQDRIGQEVQLMAYALDAMIEMYRGKGLLPSTTGTAPDPHVVAQVIESARWVWNSSAKKPRIPIEFATEADT